MPSFYEFFAGGGMARAGLGKGWTCLFANDFDPAKGRSYTAAWGAGAHFRLADIRGLTAADLPGRADLAWASFPCQDLSLAGAGAGLAGARSGAFHPFFDLVRALAREGRAPPILALENVCGALTSHGGADFRAICQTFDEAGYRLGPLVIDAALFRPQSRPRLFLIGLRADLTPDPALAGDGPERLFHPPALVRAAEALADPLRRGLIWWRSPAPAPRNLGLSGLIEDEPGGVAWHTPEQTRRTIALMSPSHRTRLEAMLTSGGRTVGALYRRTRPDGAGGRIQRAEARFDDLAGCLRTPAGGSSRQVLLIIEGGQVRSRLISARETARLMGLADDYPLPANYNEAYRLTGDGVCVDVVRHLARTLFEPLLIGLGGAGRAAA
jgi:DNA (cytosine-5)-methyltransferase 1